MYLKLQILGLFFYCFLTMQVYGQKQSSNYYYLGQIFDQREVKTPHVGYVYQNNESSPKPFYLKNDWFGFLTNNLQTVFKGKIDPYFVDLNLIKFQYSEKLNAMKIVEGQLDFTGNFFIKNSYDSTVIFPFKFNTKYKRPVEDDEKLLNIMYQINSELHKNLESWFQKNYEKNYKLARHVVVRTSDFTPKEIEEDTLYFKQRKLTVDDFSAKGKAPSKFAASIFTSMGYHASMKMSQDTVFLDLAVKVYQVKGMSWILEEAKQKFVIDHEQTHFNITQLIAEKFKKRLQEEALPPNDFDSRIQFLYLEYYRMINKLQAQYDGETSHGLNKTEQAKWEKYIDDELAKCLTNN